MKVSLSPLGRAAARSPVLMSHYRWVLRALLTRFAAPQEPRGPPAPPRPLALTSREREILRLLAAGKTAKPIATELGLSLFTVRTHIQNLLRKLEVHSCLEAVVCFLRGRRVDPEPPS